MWYNTPMDNGTAKRRSFMAREVRIGPAGGMRMVLAPCEAESVAVGVFVASGSRHESPATSGISHLIEHMLFKGTATRRPIDITREIEGRGGMLNACTGEEATCYYAHLPDDFLAEAMEILSDIYLRATMPEDEFAREKSVVIDEIKMYADEPDQVAAENLQRNLFPRSQLGAPVAGTPESLAPLTTRDLKDYVRAHYRPGNTILAVAGSFDPERAVAIARRCFGGFRRSQSAAPQRKRPFGRVVPESIVERDVQQAQLALGYRTFGVSDRRKFAATLLDGVLGRGMMSRLFQELREKKGISYDISSRLQLFSDSGMFTVSAGMDPSKAQVALRTICREIERLKTRRVSAAELKRTKEFLVGNFRLSCEKVTTKLFLYAQSLLSFGRIVEPQEQVDGVLAVTADDLISTAREVFDSSRRSVSWVMPRGHAAGCPKPAFAG